MIRAIGYSGALRGDYNICDDIIKELTNAIQSAEDDKSFLVVAQGCVEECDCIGGAILSAIDIVNDKIERMMNFKEKLEKYLDNIKDNNDF